jgi:hypothetical protein
MKQVLQHARTGQITVTEVVATGNRLAVDTAAFIDSALHTSSLVE